MLFRSVAAPRVEEAVVDVKTEVSDTQEIAVAGPSSADAAFVEVYPQRNVIKSASNWTGKANRTVCLRELCDFFIALTTVNSLCGLVVRDSGYRSRSPGFDFRPYQIF
jgi:hypothetical protein